MNRWEKQIVFYRGYFLGKELHNSIEALRLVIKYHNGIREDGSPENSHMLEIAGDIISLLEDKVSKEDLDLAVTIGLLHDLPEDYPELYSLEKVRERFGQVYFEHIKAITKKADFKKTKEDRDEYFFGMYPYILTIIGKAKDRIHNMHTIVGSKKKTIEKREKYIQEIKDYFFPMLKYAREKYPKYKNICINLKVELERQIKFIEHINYTERRLNKIESLRSKEKEVLLNKNIPRDEKGLAKGFNIIKIPKDKEIIKELYFILTLTELTEENFDEDNKYESYPVAHGLLTGKYPGIRWWDEQNRYYILEKSHIKGKEMKYEDFMKKWRGE